MPDGEANYVFFLAGGASLREHFITTGNHETARGIPILEFAMKRVEAQPTSAALKHRTSQYSSRETRENKNSLFYWGNVTPEGAPQVGTGDGGLFCPPPIDDNNQVLGWLFMIG